MLKSEIGALKVAKQWPVGVLSRGFLSQICQPVVSMCCAGSCQTRQSRSGLSKPDRDCVNNGWLKALWLITSSMIAPMPRAPCLMNWLDLPLQRMLKTRTDWAVRVTLARPVAFAAASLPPAG